MFNRREITILVAASIARAATGIGPSAAEEYPLPNPATFESGDLVWPKKPHVYVPYNAGTHEDPDADRRRWEVEKEQFLDQNPMRLSSTRLNEIRQLSYDEFYARYTADQYPNTPGVYGTGGGIYVGHVGIIWIDPDGIPSVIEAVAPSVRVIKYADWIKARPGEVVWLGRIRDTDKNEREKVPKQALKQLDKPYRFWNLDLDNDSGFYCSKLVWQSIYRSLGFAIDGNPDPKRTFWFSPKQLLYLKTIARLHDPGPYATD
jgi:hypothetical protein